MDEWADKEERKGEGGVSGVGVDYLISPTKRKMK